jgi:tetratricopeptide (TPR) repeat protein
MIRVDALLIGAIASLSIGAAAQAPRTGATDRGTTSAAPARCPSMEAPAIPTDSERVAARALIQRAQQAALLGDRASAREQWRQAAALDPTDADLAYQLARAHDGAGASAEATMEYCRFLALAPDAPEAAEARERLVILSTGSRAALPAPALPSPARALALGLIVPGAGQFYTGRPLRGTLALTAAGAAIALGLEQRTTRETVEQTALDPFGNPYQYTVVRTATNRPWLVPGLAAAGAIGLASAIEAFSYTRRMNDEQRFVLDVVPRNGAVALRFTMR